MSNSRWKNNTYGTTIRRRHNRHGPRFVQLFHWMLTTPAWQSLSPSAVVAYLELVRRYNGANNGELHLSQRELATRCGCSQRTASRAMAELVAKGFVEVTRESGFNVKDRRRQATEYRVTALFCDLTKKPASNAFQRWKARPEAEITEPSERHHKFACEAAK